MKRRSTALINTGSRLHENKPWTRGEISAFGDKEMLLSRWYHECLGHVTRRGSRWTRRWSSTTDRRPASTRQPCRLAETELVVRSAPTSSGKCDGYTKLGSKYYYLVVTPEVQGLTIDVKSSQPGILVSRLVYSAANCQNAEMQLMCL